MSDSNNTVTVRGNLAYDPFFDYLQGKDGETPFTRFALAVDRQPPRTAGPADHLLVVVYGNLAERVHPYLRKGSEISVEGWLRARAGVNHHGEQMRITEVVAEDVEFIRNINWDEGNASAANAADSTAAEQPDFETTAAEKV
jgi:single stranded DNA-binding protein